MPRKNAGRIVTLAARRSSLIYCCSRQPEKERKRGKKERKNGRWGRSKNQLTCLSFHILEQNEVAKLSAMKTETEKQDAAKHEWFTISEVAAYFQISPKTVRKWVYERKLRHYKVGGLVRIHVSDVKKFPVIVPTAQERLAA